jgi:6-pyruvoyltetrahydropterin/6-carboxytetrahydropterin synthase
VSFLVEVDYAFRAVQGLPSPVRRRSGFPATTGVELIVTAGVTFEDQQLTERGWFFDTDQAAEILEKHCAHLRGQPWTEVFEFRPTFELVARDLYGRLAKELAQLAFVRIRDETFRIVTRYAPSS